MLQAIVMGGLRVALRPLMGVVSDNGKSSDADIPNQLDCFQDEPGKLKALWLGRPPDFPLHFVADEVQDHPLAPDHPQLVIEWNIWGSPVFTLLRVIPRPNPEQIRRFRLAGYHLTEVKPVHDSPALPQLCDDLARVVEGQQRIPQLAPGKRRAGKPQKLRLRELTANGRRAQAHDVIVAA